MLSKYKQVIWDWNGTILNDVHLAIELINGLLAPRSIPTLTIEKYREIFTIPVKDYYEKAGIDFSTDPFEIIGKQWIDQYEIRKFECSMYPGVEELLLKNKLEGKGQSVLSGYKQNSLESLIGHYNLTRYFDHIVGLDDIYAGGKMHKGIELMNRLNLKKGEAVMIGDMVHDYEVACEMGADCILLANGHESRQKLEKCNVPVIEDIRELLR